MNQHGSNVALARMISFYEKLYQKHKAQNEWFVKFFGHGVEEIIHIMDFSLRWKNVLENRLKLRQQNFNK